MSFVAGSYEEAWRLEKRFINDLLARITKKGFSTATANETITALRAASDACEKLMAAYAEILRLSARLAEAEKIILRGVYNDIYDPAARYADKYRLVQDEGDD